MKLSIKTLLHNYLVTMARNYEGKRFWPSLTRSLLSAAISIVLTALVLPRAFSVQNLANQIWSGFFFFLCLNGGMKLFENIREKGFTARLTKVCKDIPSSFYGVDSNFKSILWGVFTIIIGCVLGSIFMPPLVALALGLNLFFSATMGPKSFILMMTDAIPKGNTYRKNRRGRILALLGVAIFIGFIISACIHKGVFVAAPGHETGINKEVSKGSSKQEPKTETINLEYGITGSELAASDAYLEIETEYSATNQMVQTYTINDIPSVCRENEWFMSDIEGRDYLITDFTGGKIYTLWVYDEFGDVDAIRGMTVYKSEDALLKEHQDLSDTHFDENGYMRKENVLYYEMPVNEVIAASANRDKYTMLLYAASKAFDDYFYFFSMPYNTVSDKSDIDIDIVEAGKDYSDYTFNDYESVQNLTYGDAFYDKDGVYEENASVDIAVTVPDEEKGVGENFYQGDIYVEYIREYTSQEAKSINMYYVTTDVFFEKEDDTYTIIIDVYNPLNKKTKVKKIDCLISDGTIYNDRTIDINTKINSESAARIYIPVPGDAIEGLDSESIDLYSYGIEMDD